MDNGDGDLDIVAATHQNDSTIAWYENNGALIQLYKRRKRRYIIYRSLTRRYTSLDNSRR